MNGMCIKILEERGVKPTSIRILILRTMLGFNRAFSMTDLEYTLETVDKSTVSRTIHLFLEHKLIHGIDDGSGSIKYAVCNDSCNCDLDDLHIHFHCRKCGKTFCLENIAIPGVKAPDGLLFESANLVIKGICNECPKLAT
jgi:Fur family ferric uptake transcriptional regulator